MTGQHWPEVLEPKDVEDGDGVLDRPPVDAGSGLRSENFIIIKIIMSILFLYA